MASILLNSENDSTITISCLTEEGLQSHTIILQESLCNKEQKFHLEHYDKSDSCSLEIFSQKIVFYNVHILPNSTIFDLFPNATNVSIGYSSISNYPKKRDNNIESIIALSLIIFDILLLVFLHIRKRRKNFRNNESIIHTIVHEERYLGNAKRKSSVYLFGNFKVISKDGEDITRMFSPVIRELFLLIVCNTPKGGISAKNMDELLWFDKGHKSASNNRAVSISKLRNLIAKIGEGQIVAKNGNFVYEPVNVYIDYLVFAKIVASKNFDKGSIAELVSMASAGGFLNDFSSGWTDNLKSGISDTILTILCRHITSMDIAKNADEIVSICDAINQFDHLNETALEYKCKAYRIKGNPSLARQVFTHYTKDYLISYGENYMRDFSDIIGM